MVAIYNRRSSKLTSAKGARSRGRRAGKAVPSESGGSGLQGARNRQAARAAEPQTETQRQQIFAVEEEGRRRSRGDDGVAADVQPGPVASGSPANGAKPTT